MGVHVSQHFMTFPPAWSYNFFVLLIMVHVCANSALPAKIPLMIVSCSVMLWRSWSNTKPFRDGRGPCSMPLSLCTIKLTYTGRSRCTALLFSHPLRYTLFLLVQQWGGHSYWAAVPVTRTGSAEELKLLFLTQPKQVCGTNVIAALSVVYLRTPSWGIPSSLLECSGFCCGFLYNCGQVMSCAWWPEALLGRRLQLYKLVKEEREISLCSLDLVLRDRSVYLFSGKIVSSRTSVSELPGMHGGGIGCLVDAVIGSAVSVHWRVAYLSVSWWLKLCSVLW